MTDLDLTGRTALVTGGGNGVGTAICRALVDAGIFVWVNDIYEERADKVAADFVHVADASLDAIGSRSAERAAAFAERHRAARAHGSYADLIGDPDLDAIYIATPHPQHAAIALAAVANGKAVLVEKAFTATVAGAAAVIER